jgi:hypothetical protein
MNTPGFTAEASFRTTKDNYASTLKHAPESDRVSPQMFCIGGTCCQCWDEGGISGCVCHRLRAYSLQ